jgi:mannan endo-1,4-beta-mannosidase
MFSLNGKPYRFVGANFWYAGNIAADGDSGQQRLVRELDYLASVGVKNFRIQVCSEGGDEIKLGVKPSLQPKQGEYNETMFRGIDFLIGELRKRNMQAVFVLNNYWAWTGGMAKYLNWNGAGEIPYPDNGVPGSWSQYMEFTDSFYENPTAVASFRRHIAVMVNRVNSITGVAYKDEPAIMAWQLGNEPRGSADSTRQMVFIKWIGETADYIKSLDKNHMVTVGSEGKVGHQQNIRWFEQANAFASIDYLNMHMWPQNWSWFDPNKPDSTFDSALVNARAYMTEHIDVATKLHKPIVVEEFGLARDFGKMEIDAPDTYRAKFFGWILEEVYQNAKAGKPLAGSNFWGWSGEGRPSNAGGNWAKGDDLIGDPPHEPQGWYAVYDTDKSMVSFMKEYAQKMDSIH